MLLGCYGISLLWSARGCADRLDTPIVEKGRSIADVSPGSNRLTPNEIGSSRTPSSIENAGHDNPNPGAEHRPITTAPEKAKVPNQAVRSQDSIGERKEANVINRRVTEFRTISHAEGEITTGWEYEDGYAGAPIRQYCYYMVPHSAEKYKSDKVDIAYDGNRLPDVDAASLPHLEVALSKCQWWNGDGIEAFPAKR
jgi:hypothetical protein